METKPSWKGHLFSRSAVLFYAWLHRPVSIAPLATLRVVMGAMLLFSTLRFWALGWIEDHYLSPVFHFKYYGFEWISVLPAWAMYGLHVLMVLGAVGVMVGLYYRVSALLLCLTFTYTELIDLTYYLNHYYFVSIALLLLVFAPANRSFSVDVLRNPLLRTKLVPLWAVGMFKLQLAIVYLYAGLWKINEAWLGHALPLKIWIPAADGLPLIGPLMAWTATPWLFSWAGMLYDTTIVGWLSWRKTRLFAYLTVVFFHGITGLMFQIGVFPLVMICATLVFFSAEWHHKWQGAYGAGLLRIWPRYANTSTVSSQNHGRRASPFFIGLLVAHCCFQLVFPWRYLLYPDNNIFWTEEGYRFSWRVMLMEKAGTATFYVKDARTGREGEVVNREFLNAHQEKQMAMQPDMILQFAHFLSAHYQKKGVAEPSVRAEVFVTLNGKPSRQLIDPNVDLTKIRDGWTPKTWILKEDETPGNK